LSKIKPVKVLVIRFSSIGDIVLTTPVMRGLHEQLGAEVHFLTKALYKDLVSHNRHVFHVHTFNESLSEVTAELVSHDFDYIIDLHKNIRSKKIVSVLKSKTYTVDKRSLDRWLLVTMKIDRLKGNHIVDRYMNTVLALGVKKDSKGLDIFLPENGYKNQDLPDSFIVLVVGTKHKTKDIPIQLAKDIVSNLQENVVLIGGKEHKETADAIAINTSVFNLVGKTSLLDSIAILALAKVVITPDTGMMHITAALKKPIIAIYGSTASSLGFTPYMPENEDLYKIIEEKTLSCRPCTKMGRNSCPKNHFNCMNNLDYLTVVEKARAFID